MSVVSNLLYLLVVLALGVAGRSVGLLDDARTRLLTAGAFYVALPALVFTSTSTQRLDEVLEPRLVVGFWTVLFVVAGLGWVVHRGESSPAVRSVAVVQSYHCNLGFLGLPIVAATFGGVVTAKASLVLGVGVLTQVPLTVAVFAFVTEAEADIHGALRDILTNPVLLALVAGLAAAAVGVTVPAVVSDGLGRVADLALPLALLAVGASLSFDRGTVDPGTVGSVLALKMLVMPVVALATFWALSADLSTTRAGVLMLAMPTAVSTFVYATELGGDPDLASANVFATTVASVGTVLLVLRFVG
ncbi:AEC family transporter [Halomarina ordinaria]|uniref:AEC family transporter n=1 Tax=Halomarina ordinaria TaxID=3033939 RepID=A0ABD5UE71_9EURY|nr:AEC family transporter [Halomarina sp. PSRA2]